MPKIFRAQPYRQGALSSTGDAAYMLIRQHQFPTNEYDESDKLLGADHDRCFMWDYKHARRCFAEHTGTGEGGLESWIRKSWPKDILAFLKDILKADEQVEWTGFRILGTVHRGNGYPVWTLELFAKSPASITEVTDDEGRESFGVGDECGYSLSGALFTRRPV